MQENALMTWRSIFARPYLEGPLSRRRSERRGASHGAEDVDARVGDKAAVLAPTDQHVAEGQDAALELAAARPVDAVPTDVRFLQVFFS